MKLNNKKLYDYLLKRFDNDEEVEKFLNPSENDFRDAHKLKNMDAAVQKIKTAIDENKKILIYGDYDTDGICASTILYLYFKKIGANVDVFIPNRFENGYGISIDAIEEIESEYNPDLIVTVDLGITAIEEVEILKQEGIDIVITDHHLPLDEIPDTIVVDPKLESEYGFDALCGAGVALKVVEAMAGRDEANKYLDIAAIATVGDIVPLVDENRAIARLGIDKINKKDCLKSITFMLEKLEISELTSTDVSFKIVPRLNASGRMDSALKVFNFLIQTDEKMLAEAYSEIETDNMVRLSFIDKGNKQIEKQLKKYNNDEPSVLIKGDFHEGIVGILASRVCHEFNKPAIIFTKTENGTLKGSGRSIPELDLHEIIAEMQDMLVNFGGHKMAIGVEIEEDAFEEFKNTLNQKINDKFSKHNFIMKSGNYDIEIENSELNLEFLNELNALEPFGCENEKPILAIRETKMNTARVSERSPKHYKFFTEKNIPILAFNSYKYIPIIESETEKLIFIDLSKNTYKNKVSVSAIFKGLSITRPNFLEDKNFDFLPAIRNKYYSIFDFNNPENYHVEEDLKTIIKSKFSEDEFGTLVVCSNAEDLRKLDSLDIQDKISFEPHRNGQNTVLISPNSVYDVEDVAGYKNIIFLHKYFNEEHLYFSNKLNVFEPKEIDTRLNLKTDRETFVQAFKLISTYKGLKVNDELEFARVISKYDQALSCEQILFCLIVFMELNFVEFDETLSEFVMLKAKKMELSSSKMFMEVCDDRNIWWL